MIDYKYFDLFQHSRGSVEKDWKIEYDGGSFTDWDMESESIELSESLCSEKELRFGCCEASCLKFTVANIVKPLINEWITLSVAIDHHNDEPLMVGRYKVNSENLTADWQYKEIIAYDAMYDIINADVAAWYNSILPSENSTVTMKQFRESFLRYFGLTEVVPEDGLVNDNMTVERTVDPEQMSGLDVISAICEINGCFGHIGRDGKFHYIYLPQAIEGLYPADDLYPDHAPEWMAQAKTGHLYPQDPKGTKVGADSYIECHYEEYRTKPITKLQIRQEENDIGKIWPEGDVLESDNCYIIQDNFLVYGKSSEQLAVIAQNIFGKITDIVYRPFDADVMGNPCFEVGDPVRFFTTYELVESYILQRTLKGIQALRDDYSADGVEKYSEEVNGVHSSIIQLKGKANILTRTIEETKLEMYDIESGLYNTISVTAGQIRAELKNEVDGLSNTISVTAGQIRAELKNEVDGLSNTISVTAGQIRAELKSTKEGLQSSITQTAGQIRTEVADSNNNLQSQITQNAGDIALRVTKDGVVAAINLSPEVVTIQAQKIDLQGLVNADELVSKFATITTLNASVANVTNLVATQGQIDYLVANGLTVTDWINVQDANITNLVAQKATIEQLNATNARVGSLEADHVSVENLSATTATLQNLIAQKIDASTVRADYMEVANWTSAGKIRADRIDAESITTIIAEVGTRITAQWMTITTGLTVNGAFACFGVPWTKETIGGKTYMVVAD